MYPSNGPDWYYQPDDDDENELDFYGEDEDE